MTEELKNETETTPTPATVPQTQNDPVTTSTSLTPPAVETPSNRMMNMMIGVVGVLVIMAGIQVFQTQQLMAAVSSGSIKVGAPAAQSSGSGIGVQSQVGGCG